jgi:hypothetical protein
LEKARVLEGKAVREMTPGKRGLINEIAACEEGIGMAGEVLLTVSRDEEERA